MCIYNFKVITYFFLVFLLGFELDFKIFPDIAELKNKRNFVTSRK